MNETIPPSVRCSLFFLYDSKCYLKIAHPARGWIEVLSSIAHSESECIKVLLKSSPPISGETKMIHKNQHFKELFSKQLIREGRMKAVQSRIEIAQVAHKSQRF
jgi:hypothetical protein